MKHQTRYIEDWFAIGFSIFAIVLGAGLVVFAATSKSISTTTSSSTLDVSPDSGSSVNEPSTSPTITTKKTLLGDSGFSGYLIVSIPAILAIMLFILLFRARATANKDVLIGAWVIVGFLGVISVLGALTIGELLLPIDVAMAVAAGASQRAIDRAQRAAIAR